MSLGANFFHYHNKSLTYLYAKFDVHPRPRKGLNSELKPATLEAKVRIPRDSSSVGKLNNTLCHDM